MANRRVWESRGKKPFITIFLQCHSALLFSPNLVHVRITASYWNLGCISFLRIQVLLGYYGKYFPWYWYHQNGLWLLWEMWNEQWRRLKFHFTADVGEWETHYHSVPVGRKYFVENLTCMFYVYTMLMGFILNFLERDLTRSHFLYWIVTLIPSFLPQQQADGTGQCCF